MIKKDNFYLFCEYFFIINNYKILKNNLI